MVPTRQSLLSRLRDCQDQEGWREFFETYWRLIYRVARGSDLSDLQAQEVVQNTFIYLSRRMPRFQYNREGGSFKSWLRAVTQSRINIYLRAEKGHLVGRHEPFPGSTNEDDDVMGAWPDPAGNRLDEIWQREWEDNLLKTAFRRLRPKVSAQQLLIFRAATFGGLSASQVAEKLDVSVAQIYLARHRVGRLFKAEVRRLRKETE